MRELDRNNDKDMRREGGNRGDLYFSSLSLYFSYLDLYFDDGRMRVRR